MHADVDQGTLPALLLHPLARDLTDLRPRTIGQDVQLRPRRVNVDRMRQLDLRLQLATVDADGVLIR